MGLFVEKLLSICSDDLSLNRAPKSCIALCNSPLAGELENLLAKKNGFYGFESALHVFPYETTDKEIGLMDWNEKTLWISSYENMALDAFFFAEDIFGGQFCLKNDGVYSFDPETGEFNKLAGSINEWCGNILSEYQLLTGCSLANAWQKINGELPAGYRLVPKIPFIAGGQYDLDNLYLSKSYESLKSRANIALQIRDIPDGGSIQIVIKD
ncbi:SMI1/KNR4 family protein [Buttiauxella sp. A2-C2_NF]|uniref:SMI1/KNR4 family protein n=1 Tax=Buttiauxella ferragutiae TaxID=82989 RepID=UPI001E5C7CF4|nr:SMI1/KNR4 family protein [Buttiauxella ferragutiae]MCE0829061.1 SMI1/KNR4 family protein [Buttiauxella ferragutiae]UNK63067.1 SMI1/KNR4 family protein [Buttiauxella ferragutiae]